MATTAERLTALEAKLDEVLKEAQHICLMMRTVFNIEEVNNGESG